MTTANQEGPLARPHATTKHTPGPWQTAGGCTVVRDLHLRKIAHVTRGYGDGAGAERDANAKLIAAAPRLAAFVAHFVDVFGDLTTEDVFATLAEDPSVLTDFISKARVALP